ncbi:MAG: protein kinase domain-containing protein, partial [Thermoplasmatota archaeon]
LKTVNPKIEAVLGTSRSTIKRSLDALIQGHFLRDRSTGRRRSKVELDIKGDGLCAGKWQDAELSLNNVGDVFVKNVRISPESDNLLMQEPKPVKLIKAGEESMVELKMMVAEIGSIPVEIKVRYTELFNNQDEDTVETLWVDVVEEQEEAADVEVSPEKEPEPEKGEMIEEQPFQEKEPSYEEETKVAEIEEEEEPLKEEGTEPEAELLRGEESPAEEPEQFQEEPPLNGEPPVEEAAEGKEPSHEEELPRDGEPMQIEESSGEESVQEELPTEEETLPEEKEAEEDSPPREAEPLEIGRELDELSDVVDENIRQKISGIKILERVPRRGPFELYHVRDSEGREHFLKRFRSDVLEELGARALEFLSDELNTWKRLTRKDELKEGIIEVRELKEEPEPYLLVEYMGKGSIMDNAEDMDLEGKIKALSALLETLSKVHPMGLFHMDLRPDCILMDDSGKMRIGDWSEAKAQLSREKHPKYFRYIEGDIGNFAPEQISPEDFGGVDRRTDVYQVGVLAYELFTGNRPFSGTPETMKEAIIASDPIHPSDINVDIPKRLGDIILRAMSKKKMSRYRDASIFLDRLKEVLAEL